MADNVKKVDTNKILTVALSDIFVDPSWNTRSAFGEGEGSGGEDGENDYESLKASIAMRGQDMPVDVRVNPGKTKHTYALVAGFRRFKAISDLAEQAGNKTPTIRAVVHNFGTEAEAIEFNVRENTARQDLSAPDTVYGVARLLKSKSGVTDSELAQSLGFSQPYISKIHRVIDKVSAKTLGDWRDRVGLKPTLDQMHSLVKIEDKQEQAKAYEEMVRGKEEGGKKGGRNAWIENTKKKAHDVGYFLGSLQRAGVIAVPDEDRSFYDQLDVFVKVKAEANDKQRMAFSDALHAGYLQALEEDETPAETEKPAKKTKESKANGAETSAN